MKRFILINKYLFIILYDNIIISNTLNLNISKLLLFNSIVILFNNFINNKLPAIFSINILCFFYILNKNILYNNNNILRKFILCGLIFCFYGFFIKYLNPYINRIFSYLLISNLVFIIYFDLMISLLKQNINILINYKLVFILIIISNLIFKLLNLPLFINFILNNLILLNFFKNKNYLIKNLLLNYNVNYSSIVDILLISIILIMEHIYYIFTIYLIKINNNKYELIKINKSLIYNGILIFISSIFNILPYTIIFDKDIFLNFNNLKNINIYLSLILIILSFILKYINIKINYLLIFGNLIFLLNILLISSINLIIYFSKNKVKDIFIFIINIITFYILKTIFLNKINILFIQFILILILDKIL